MPYPADRGLRAALRRFAEVIVTVCVLISTISLSKAQSPVPIFVAYQRASTSSAPTAATTTTIGAAGPGWPYSGVAQVAGTTWNQILSPSSKISTVGTTTLSTVNNIALTPAGADTTTPAVTLTTQATIVSGSEPNTFSYTQPTGQPAFMSNYWYNATNTLNSFVHTLANLPANSHYFLVCYGSGNAAAQGSQFTVAAPYLGADDTSPKITTPDAKFGQVFAINNGNYSVFNQGVTWVVFHVVSDASGKLVFSSGKISTAEKYGGLLNGFQLMPYPKATITTQPASSIAVLAGDSATLQIAASTPNGSGLSITPTYQWSLNGAPVADGTTQGGATISGAKTNTLSLSNISASEAGNYICTVTTFGGAVSTTPCALSLSASAQPPSVTNQPANATGKTGDNVAFTVVAQGTALSYLWQKKVDGLNWVDIPNTNAPTLALSTITTADAGYYRVYITNQVGSAYSNEATLTVLPVITAAPVKQVIDVGATATISVTADVGAGAPSPVNCVWKFNGATLADGGNIAGATTANLKVANMTAASSGAYTVTVTNAAGSVTTSPVYVGAKTTQSVTLLPSNGSTAIAPDQQLRMEFPSAPKLGSGKLTIRDASNSNVVVTIDTSTFVTYDVAGLTGLQGSKRTVQGTEYYYQPIAIYGNTVWITLSPTQIAALGYNKTYYVNLEGGLILDSTNAAYPAITDSTTWRFTTKAAAVPAATASTGLTAVTVGLDGTGDFATLQGAINWVPANNTLARTITILPGLYYDYSVVGINQPNVTIVGGGAARDDVKIVYPSPLPTNGATYAATLMIYANDTTVRNISLDTEAWKTFPGIIRTLFARGCYRVTFENLLIKGGQDAVYTYDGGQYFYDCEIWGSVDFIYGAALAVFDHCKIVQVRGGGASITAPNTAFGQPYGLVFLNCTFPRALKANGYPYDVDVNSTYFMRPWFQDGATALINCAVGAEIPIVGWSDWGGRATTCIAREYGTISLENGTPITVAARQNAGTFWLNTRDPDYTSAAMSASDPALVYPSGAANRVSVDVNPADYTLDAIFGNAYFANTIGSWRPSLKPRITTQPSNQTVVLGSPATFSVVATGVPAPSYRWYKDGAALDIVANPSAATPQLNLSNVQVSDLGSYSVVVTNGAGAVTSVAAALSSSGQSPVITTHPTNQMVAPGGSVSLSVSAVGGTLNYRWQFNGADLADGAAGDGAVISGATTSTLNLSNAQIGHEGNYAVVVSNINGSTPSNTATLIVDAVPVITSQPISQAVTAGAQASFSVTASGASTYQYQWKRNGVSIAGATSQVLTLSSVTSADAGAYTVVVSSRAGSATSNAATLTISSFATPAIPSATFNVTAYGAVGDGLTDNTAAIQAAINAAKLAGGGTVKIPAGVYLCGPLTLGNYINLYLDAGCTLRLLPMYTWPNAPYTSPGTPNFITASGLHDVQVSGAGTIDGQGQPWWDRFDGTNGVPQQTTYRPAVLINFENVTNGAILGVKTLNPPNLHIGVGLNSRYVIVSGITLSAPSDSPNTDGIHIAGKDLLVDGCTINTGDDDIVINSGNSGPATENITVTNCYIGTGHGCSIGSFTNASGNGIKNVTVDNCTFVGTNAGINMKSQPGRGGVVQNLTYSNLTMTNVVGPFTIYSYYGTVGNAGASGSNRNTPSVAAGYNLTPPVSLADASRLPEWKNIVFKNITITGSSNYSILWGLPNKPVTDVTFTNIKQTGGYGFEIYNARNVQFTGTNSISLQSGRDLFTTYNALVIAGQPQSQTVSGGGTAVFTVTTQGTSGVNAIAPKYQWACNGAPLADGVQGDGTSISGSTTATLTLSNVSAARTGGLYTVTATNNLDFYDVIQGALIPNSLPVAATSAAAVLTVNQTYTSWATAKGLTGANNGPTADPDFDGIPNQLEYLLGLDPLSPNSSGLPTGTSENGQFVFRFTHDKGASDITYTVQQSTDLLTWTPLSTSVESSNATTETLSATLPLTGAKQFVRLSSGSVSTVPVGFMNFTFSTGSTTAFGLPLEDTSATPVGLRAGQIESLTATTLTNSGGNWTGNLADAAAPWGVRITSGAAAGKLLDIASNTATTLTLSNASLTSAGVLAGDTFELVPFDTLGTLFGSSTLQGGTSSANADVVQVRSGTSWLPYYYDTTLNYWRRTAGVNTNASNTVIRPGSVMMLTRRGGPLTLTFIGRVLGTTYRTPVANASTTGITTGFPTDTTLGGLHLQTLLSGWRSGTTTSAADSINLYNGSTWVPYLFNGSNWQTVSGTNSDNVALPAGAALLIQRPGSAAGTTDLITSKPY